MTSRRFHAANAASGLLLALTFPALIAACSGGDEFTSTGGASGAGGSAGGSAGAAAGTGGTSAQAGSSGATAGTGGGSVGGAAGTAGAGTAGGTAGKGGAGTGGGTAGASGASAGKGGAAGGGGSAVGGAGGTGGAPACDPTEKAPMMAIHVVAGAANSGADGSEAKPFGTVVAALAAQKNAPHSTPIVVAPGTYDGALDIAAASAAANVIIAGGWTPTFTRDCSPTASDTTTLTATGDALAVVLVQPGETVTLRTLTVKTKGSAPAANHDKPGISLVGIIVRGGGDLTLQRVHVVVGKGGTGGPASNPVPAMPPPCDGLSSCSDGGKGGDGAAAPMSGAGMFTDIGYATGDGAIGEQGKPGANGSAGKVGDAGPCVSCKAGTLPTTCEASTTSTTAASGKCGCGGVAPTPAVSGHGGGASVGVWVVSGGKVSLVESVITAGTGGDGSAPSNPGTLILPTAGTAGPSQVCDEPNAAPTCLYAVSQAKCIPSDSTPVTLKGGEAGGDGGPAGKTGASSGGSGGPSIAIVHAKSVTPSIDAASTLVPGIGGTGAGGPNGMAAPQLGY